MLDEYSFNCFSQHTLKGSLSALKMPPASFEKRPAIFSMLPVTADLRTVHKFKKVAISFNLTHDGAIIEKGTFDFAILVERSLRIWTLKVIKKGKVLCALPGEILRDRAPGTRGETTSEVPEKPTFSIKKISDEKMVHLIFENAGMETGAMLFPYYAVRFKMGLVQE